jgi:hypothetical protein
MDTNSSPIGPNEPERLRAAAAAQGVHPTDADLGGVQDFLDRILPALAALEQRLPPESAP